MFYSSTPPRKFIRHNGSAALAIIVVMGIVSSLMGVSMAKVTSVSTHSLSSNKITLQAHQLASDKAELLKSETYSSLASQGKKAVDGSLYYDEVTVGKETAMPSNHDIKQKSCRVNVYYGDESIPRATLSFNRYSTSQNESSIPKGTILPWYGKSSDIPDGFALCDGTKGTPDLRNRFLVGAGSNYSLGDTGGEDQVRLTNQQIGNHYHYWSGMYTSDPHYETYKRTGLKLVSFGYDSNISSYFDAPFPTGRKMLSFFTNNANLSSVNMSARFISTSDFSSAPMEYITSFAVGTDAQEPHENRPPYYALYYIMKLE